MNAQSKLAGNRNLEYAVPLREPQFDARGRSRHPGQNRGPARESRVEEDAGNINTMLREDERAAYLGKRSEQQDSQPGMFNLDFIRSMKINPQERRFDSAKIMQDMRVYGRESFDRFEAPAVPNNRREMDHRYGMHGHQHASYQQRYPPKRNIQENFIDLDAKAGRHCLRKTSTII